MLFEQCWIFGKNDMYIKQQLKKYLIDMPETNSKSS